jgi:hypothetical protein
VKGHDPLAEVKGSAAKRWVAAVNSGGGHGRWRYALVREVAEVCEAISAPQTS